MTRLSLLLQNPAAGSDSMIILGFVVVAFLLFSNWNGDGESSDGGCSSGCGS